MKILLLNSLGIYGGGEFFVLELSLYLQSKGHDVWVGCVNGTPLQKNCADTGIKATEFDFPVSAKGKLKKNINAIKEFIVSNQIQIVHTNTNYDRTAGAIAARLAGAAHVASVHSLQSIRHNLTHWTRNRFLVDVFIADGKTVSQFLINEDKINPKKISEVDLGVDPSAMKRDNGLRNKIRKEFNLRENDILIGNLGRLVGFKGQDLLIDSFALIAKEIPNAVLMIVGEGELRGKLENLARSLALTDRIIFAGFRDDLQAVYSAFDIYAHTSERTGGELFPFAVLYAMASGLPIVSTDAGEIPHMIGDEIGGFITERDPRKIALKLTELVNDPTLRQKTGEAGLKRLTEQFTLEKMGSSILKLYEKVLSKRNR